MMLVNCNQGLLELQEPTAKVEASQSSHLWSVVIITVILKHLPGLNKENYIAVVLINQGVP